MVRYSLRLSEIDTGSYKTMYYANPPEDWLKINNVKLREQNRIEIIEGVRKGTLWSSVCLLYQGDVFNKDVPPIAQTGSTLLRRSEAANSDPRSRKRTDRRREVSNLHPQNSGKSFPFPR